jgi:hypothetical protein
MVLKVKKMKRIIKGKTYNTEASTKVASYWNGLGIEDFRYVSRKLYLTKKGYWFLQYDGGTGIVDDDYWDEKYDDESYGIRPMTEEEAYCWLEQNSETKAIETYFSHILEEA